MSKNTTRKGRLGSGEEEEIAKSNLHPEEIRGRMSLISWKMESISWFQIPAQTANQLCDPEQVA